ncbi:hypothetical protein [Brachybacterium sp. YJGR34]|uniref:hypothetical protein n=1 Tax=Brachybacterium sp. YJGR34 TaxID=2059911 RepID=UPI000E0CB54E|nr:hypothetical protein [Brachybacterium sp. YJGR34]
MAQEREESPGYDWEDPSVPGPPASTALPDHGAGPRPAPDGALLAPPEPGPAPARWWGSLPPWAIVAIVVVQATALVLCLVLVLGGLQRLRAPDSAAPTAAPTTDDPADEAAASPRERGRVTDAAGVELGGGIGDYDRPASVGEHTFVWDTWSGGTFSVTAREVDLAASFPQGAGEEVLAEGHRLVEARYEVRYDGPGQIAPVEELWLTGESDLSYFPDLAEGLAPDPMEVIPPLASGETASFRSLYIVPEDEIGSFRLGVETPRARTLYYAT